MARVGQAGLTPHSLGETERARLTPGIEQKHLHGKILCAVGGKMRASRRLRQTEIIQAETRPRRLRRSVRYPRHAGWGLVRLDGAESVGAGDSRMMQGRMPSRRAGASSRVSSGC
jgi:hypothetical protein